MASNLIPGKAALAFALLALAGTGTCGEGPSAEPLSGVNRVLFLGDSITYGGVYIEFIETWFRTRLPARSIEFINAGLPSETVSGLSESGHADGKFPRPDLHERLGRVLSATKPDLVIACYGMNDGIYLPFSEERFEKYRDGILRLRTDCQSADARIVHATPPNFDEARGGHPGYRATLERYSQWLLSRRKEGWDVVDLNGPMTACLDQRRKADPAFFLAPDGVHPNQAGHWLMAKALLIHLGARDLAEVDSPEELVRGFPRGDEVAKLVQQRQRLMKDAWLTETRHLRPGMKQGIPLPDARKQYEQIEKQLRD
jgi:lysophospholipase L1-like esterase